MRNLNLFGTTVAIFAITLSASLPVYAGGDGHSHAASAEMDMQSMKGMEGMEGMEGTGMPENHNMHDGMEMSDTVQGTVIAIDRKKRKLVLEHEKMPTMGMDAMTMGYSVADNVDLKKLKKGKRLLFTVEMVSGGGMQITAVKPVQ